MKDKITRSIEIAAAIESVWTLVSEPGWWINTGSLGGHRIERSGDDCVVHDDQLGPFPVGIVLLEPPYRAVFSWQSGGEAAPRTTVEFTITQTAPTTVTVTVEESGFATMSADRHQQNYEANESGWRDELTLASVALAGTISADRA
jgi:uncharacterized protein YndB with AHSA1/START domain